MKTRRWLNFRAWLAGLVPVLLSGCVLAADPPIELQRPIDPRLLQNTGFDTATQIVIADQSAWRETWARLVAGRRPTPPAPEMDFAKHIVVIVAMGRQVSGGYSIRVVAVKRQASGVLVRAIALAPGRGCISTANITAPVDVVVLPVDAQPVAFDLRYESRDCD
ncbi:MAG: protease complex subunit PrcB family protein [Gammaproteobacteria bacterium]|nr:protease complex subunit PrcB family protein [Gammaproteobacteria bacterium]